MATGQVCPVHGGLLLTERQYCLYIEIQQQTNSNKRKKHYRAKWAREKTCHLCKMIGVRTQNLLNTSRFFEQLLHRSGIASYVLFCSFDSVKVLRQIIAQSQLELNSTERPIKPATGHSGFLSHRHVPFITTYTDHVHVIKINLLTQSTSAFKAHVQS